MFIRGVTKVQHFVPVKYAFISVYDKTGIADLVRQLFEICPSLVILSSGGTYTHLKKELGDEVSADSIREVSEYTGMPETEGGLVKTLHHKMFLGYLTETFTIAHHNDLLREQAVPIDLVIVDTYPFSKVISTPEITFETARGHIDVGGPSALRAAAKNFLRVMTVADYSPEAYSVLIEHLKANVGCTSFDQRFYAMQDTFRVLGEYDSEVASYLKKSSLDQTKELYEMV